MPDPRHHALMIEFDRMYHAYAGLPLPNAGRLAKRLALFLKENPRWPLRALKRAVWNRHASQGVNLSEDPALWVMKLPNYANDPLDQWGKPQRGRGNEVEKFWVENPGHPPREDGKLWTELGQ